MLRLKPQAAQAGCAAEAETDGGGAAQKIDAALRETLRLYPPVASLPRVVEAPGGLDVGGAAEGAPERHLAAGRVVMVCTVAASRAGWARPDAWDAARFLRPARGDGDGGVGSSDESSSGGEAAGEVGRGAWERARVAID